MNPFPTCWYIGGWCPRLKDCPQNFKVALQASLLGQLFIFRTIFQPWVLSYDIPAAERGLFTKYDAFPKFRLRRRNIIKYKQMYGQLELLHKDSNLARFRVIDSCRIKNRFTSSPEHTTWVTCGPRIRSSILHSAHHKLRKTDGPSEHS